MIWERGGGGGIVDVIAANMMHHMYSANWQERANGCMRNVLCEGINRGRLQDLCLKALAFMLAVAHERCVLHGESSKLLATPRNTKDKKHERCVLLRRYTGTKDDGVLLILNAEMQLGPQMQAAA